MDFIDGTLIESGYADEGFANVKTDRTAIYEQPLVILSHITFKTFNQLKPFVEVAIATKKALVIVSEMDYAVQNVLLRNVIEKGLPIVVVKPPSFSAKRKYLLEDLALICGTSMISTLDGDDFNGRAENFIGFCEKITVGKTDTILIPSKDVAQEPIIGKLKELKEKCATWAKGQRQ